MLQKTIALGRQLSKSEMKKVKGGGTCCAHSNDWSGYQCGLSIGQAQDFQRNGGWDKWCCDSCGDSMKDV